MLLDGQTIREYFDYFWYGIREEFKFIKIVGASNGSIKKTYKWDDEKQELGELLTEETIPTEPIRELGKWMPNAWNAVSPFTRAVPYALPFISLWLTVLFWYSYWFTTKHTADISPAWTECLGNIRFDSNSLLQA